MSLVRGAVDVRGLHHGSHAGLLTDEAIPSQASRLDAIIVPTARPPEALRHVMDVCAAISVPAIVLCSRDATAYHARKIADSVDAPAWSVDVDDSLAHLLPTSQVDRLLLAEGLGSTSDLSFKRNLGLVLARGAGFRRVLFLDDDIGITQPDALPKIAGLLNTYRAVGLANDGFPDNSVVCHAFREAGGNQGTFIGGGAMMVNPVTAMSYFPNIYNEDWLFLLGTGFPFQAARTGRMVQRAFDPFANPRRAVSEELGDTIAESLFWLLDSGQEINTAGTGFWGDALFRRREFIVSILERVDDRPGADRIRRSLRAALGRSTDIHARLCTDLVDAWRKDLSRWKRFLHGLENSEGPEKYIASIGLADRFHRSRLLDF